MCLFVDDDPQPWARRELMVKAARKGKHIITTKPLAANVADCTKRTMGAAAMIYHDDKLAVVARFEVPPKELELRKIKANTLGDSMLNWLCATKKPPSPVVKSPGTDSPFK